MYWIKDNSLMRQINWNNCFIGSFNAIHHYHESIIEVLLFKIGCYSIIECNNFNTITVNAEWKCLSIAFNTYSFSEKSFICLIRLSILVKLSDWILYQKLVNQKFYQIWWDWEMKSERAETEINVTRKLFIITFVYLVVHLFVW